MKHASPSLNPSLFPLGVVIGLSMLAQVGCGGMTVLNETKGTDGDVQIEVSEEEDEAHIDNCPELCAEAFGTLSLLGCNVSCDIDLGTTIEADVDIAVVVLAVAGWFDGEGVYQTGETCDVVVDCEGASVCQSTALLCLTKSDNTVDYCISEYLGCEQDMVCTELFEACAVMAMEEYQDCTDSSQECLDELEALNEICADQQAVCLGTGDEPGPPPPLPVMSGPGRWNVSMEFIGYHLNRLATLDVDTFTMMMPGSSAGPPGLAVHSIEPGDALHQLGLRDRDIITAVNDTPISLYSEQPAALLDLLAGPGVELTVRRRAGARRLRYRFVD